jgi:GTP-binding protein
MNKLPIVAIVGRANVGKSSLFNRIIGSKEAVVAREAGTTRDSIARVIQTVEKDFWLVDTAGLKKADDEFEATIQDQIADAADSAEVIVVVVEADVMITDEDRRIAKMALKTKKPVVLAVNKIDKAKNVDLDSFKKLGIKDIIHTSAEHNRGITELLSAITPLLPKANHKEDEGRVKLAILGRPNVGKSQLFNTMAKKQQAIVADVAGTTRDVNRTVVRYHEKEIELLDTAGIRRPGKIEQGVERFSVLRSLQAIEEADVCLLLLDVNELATHLDQKIAGMIKDAGKGLILVVSKWDSIDKDAYTRDGLAPRIKKAFDFVPWASLIFTSAVTGQNVAKIFDIVLGVDVERDKKITTSKLNNWLRDMVDKHPPSGLKNRHPKLNYITQTGSKPPSFTVFGAHSPFLHWSYKRYLERELRQEFGFEGTAVRMEYKEKH